MKYWKIGRTQDGYGDNEGLLLLDGEMDRIVSIAKNESGKIVFVEECDGYFSVELSKEEAEAALIEAIQWIKNA